MALVEPECTQAAFTDFMAPFADRITTLRDLLAQGDDANLEAIKVMIWSGLRQCVADVDRVWVRCAMDLFLSFFSR